MKNVELKSLRIRLGLTQAALAEAVGVVPNTLARWERGEIGIPGWAVERLDVASRSGPSGSAITRPRGVVLDPHHRAILDALSGDLDPAVFEACAVDLLKRDWPGLVPVAGGGDDGFDGAVADGGGREPFPLVVTTGTDLMGNLRRNLSRSRRKRATLDRALFATSRRVSPSMRQKLEAEASKLDVTLLQIYDQDWFAQRLYGEPPWCRRLLRVTGKPRSLSPFPVARRPVLGDRILGREREMRWLQERTGDCLLVGAPGSGKTFVLRALVLQGQALFKVDDDREQLANDLRSLKPSAVIIDDAHLDSGQIERFVQLRTEVGSDARIIATSWPGNAATVQAALQIPDSDVLPLDLIDADTMIEIVKSTGIAGPDELLYHIRLQADGRPGLAATLSHMCLAGDVRRAMTGEGLVDQLAPQINRMLDVQDATPLLAPFALGGDIGVRMERVAAQLGRPLDDVSSRLAQLAAAGVVMERRNRAVSVEPAPMRWVLVRRVFFGGVGSLDITPFLDMVEDLAEALNVLIGARSRGASIPSLEKLLERASSDRLWSGYASLGPAEARYVLERHPDRLFVVAEQALEQAPETAIPLLLDHVRKAGGSRQDPLSEDPLDTLKKWTTRPSPSRERWLYRRSTLLRAANGWWRGGGDARIALRGMCMALSPECEYATTDPGRGRTVSLHYGFLQAQDIEGLADLWTAALKTLCDMCGMGEVEPPWHDLLSLVSAWVHHPFDPLGGIPDDARNRAKQFTGRMIQGLADVCRDHPGLQHELKAAGQRLDLNVDVTLDPDFEMVYPEIDPDEEIEMMQSGPPDNTVENWIHRSPEDLARSLARIETEAELAGMNYPRLSPYLCKRLADSALDAAAFAEVLMAHGLPADVIAPFVLRAARINQPKWTMLVRRCLSEDRFRELGVYVSLTHATPPQHLLSSALDVAGDYARAVDTWCLRGEVPKATLRRMFCTPDDRVAVAAAIGYWCRHATRRAGSEVKKPCSSCGGEVATGAVVCPMCMSILNVKKYDKYKFADGGIAHGRWLESGRRLYDEWWRAILRAPADATHISQHDEYWLGEILSRNSRLAEEWLVSKFGRSKGDPESAWGVDGIAIKIVSLLDSEQRARVLATLHSDCHTDKLVKSLVADDIDLYRELLEKSDLKESHLAPLAGKPSEGWRRKALVALGKGYSIDDIVRGTFGRLGFWSGPVSEMWAGWRQAFESLRGDVDRRIAGIGERGAEIAGERENHALEIERQEDVHGW